MNSSLALIQKIENIALAGTGSVDDYAINFPLLAFPLNEDDFTFLQDKPVDNTGETALSYWRSKYQFALLANSIPTHPFVWTCDPDNLLYDSYKKVLTQASLIAPGQLSEEEKAAFDKATKFLFTETGEETSTYLKYKKFRDENDALRNKINDTNLEINKLSQTISPEYSNLTQTLNQLQQQLDDSGLKWISIGQKLEVENALTVLRSIQAKDNFVAKWQAQCSFISEDSNKATDPDTKAGYFETSCTPNDFLQPDSKYWQKFTLNKEEISNLIEQYHKEVTTEVAEQFGDIDVNLESISFEICMVSIIRSWFQPELLTSNLWKFSDPDQVVSAGKDDFTGIIPCYPTKIILLKNASFNLSDDQSNNVVKDQLERGKPIFFGNLLMKAIPSKIVKPQVLSAGQLMNFSDVKKQEGAQPQLKVPLKLKAYQALQFHTVKDAITDTKTAEAIRSIPVGRMAGFKPQLRAGMFARKLSPGLLTTINLPPQPEPAVTTFTFSGTVTDLSNKPLPQVEISLQQVENGVLQSAFTGTAGNYSFANLNAGSYHARFSKEGFNDKELDVNLTGNNATNVSLEAGKVKEQYFLVAVISKRFPKLPNPIAGANYT